MAYNPNPPTYTEGDSDADIQGNAVLMEVGSNILQPLQGTVVDGLLVNLGSNNDITGTVTANAGTNLNTSALSLETTSSAIKTAVEIIDNAISGSEMQVDIVAALPAGTNNIGDIDVLSVPAPLNVTGGGTEASALRVTIASNSTGVVSIDDNDSSLTVDGTVAATQSGTWNVTNISGTVSLPTGASTLAEQQSQTTHLATIAGDTTDIEAAVELIDDTVAVLGTTTYAEATTKGLIVGAVRRDADTTLVDTTNELSPLQVDANGRLKVEAFSGETLPVSLTSTTVTGTVAVTQSGTWDEVGINDSGNSITVDAPTGTPVNVQIGDGTRQATVRDTGATDSLNVAIVDASGNQITSFGGGTEYTEDAAAASDPVGKANILVRADTPATITTTDGDNIAQRGTNYGAAYTQIVTSAGAFVDTFGGGTQYTEGDTDATITGTAMLMEGAGNALVVAQGTAADGLLVNLGSNNDVVVTGTVTANLAAGTNNIGDVDILSVPAPLNLTGGGVEASALRVTIANDSTGVVSVDDNGSSLTVDGTVAATQSGAWNITNVSGTVSLPTGASTLAEQQTQTTHLATIAGDTTDIETAIELIDDTIITLGTDTYTEATSKGQIIAAVRRDADTPLAGTTNEYSPLITDANGYLKVEVFDGGGSHTVDNNGTFATQVDGAALTALQLIDDPVVVLGTDTYTEATSKGQVIGAVRRDADTPLANTTNEFSPLITDANGYLKVEVFDGGGTHTVDAPIGTPVNVQVGNGTLAAGVIDETGASAVDALAVGGGTAHDAVNSGNPILQGFEAIAHGSNPTAVAAADRTKGYANRHGIPFTLGGHPNIITRSVRIADADGAQTDVSIVGTISAGTKVIVTAFSITCDASNTNPVACKLGFGSSTIPADSTSGANGVLFDHEGIAAGSGVAMGNGGGILAIGADGEELRLSCEDPVGGFICITFSYFTIES